MAITNYDRLVTIFEAFIAKDMDTVDAGLHPDFVITEAPGLPYHGVYRGLDGWHQLLVNLTGSYAEVRTEWLEIIGEPNGDRFACMHKLHATSKTGHRISQQVLEIWTFKDNLVIEVLPFYFDTHAVAKATGHDMVPA